MNKYDFEQKLPNYKQYLIDNEYAKKTRSSYIRYVKKFIEWLPNDVELTKEMLIDFKQYISDEGYKVRPKNTIIAVVNKYLAWCGYDKESNVRVKKFKVHDSSSLEDIPTFNDYERMLRWAYKTGQHNVAMYMYVIAKTGIRAEEIKYFTVENINNRSWVLEVYNKGKTRKLPIPNDLLRDLRAYCKDHEIADGKIFPYHYATYYKKLQKIAGAAKVSQSRISAHKFRHMFAKNFMESKGNVLTLADILGHNDIKTTRVYTRSSMAEMRKDMESSYKNAKRKTKEKE